MCSVACTSSKDFTPHQIIRSYDRNHDGASLNEFVNLISRQDIDLNYPYKYIYQHIPTFETCIPFNIAGNKIPGSDAVWAESRSPTSFSNLDLLLPAIAHRSVLGSLVAKYLVQRRPVYPVAPTTIMSSSLILSFGWVPGYVS